MISATKAAAKRSRGFTLIELMITVAVVAILAAIALPSYQRYVLRAQRADGRSALQAVAQRMEQYYNLNGTYAGVTTANLSTWGMNQVPLSGAARYNISFTANPGATGFTAQAVPAGAQTADTECGTLLLDNRNVKGALGTLDNRAAATLQCWNR